MKQPPYTTPSAYHHSFKPHSTAAYAIRLVESGVMDPQQAVQQAACEHGQAQADEFEAAILAHLPTGQVNTRGTKGWLRYARRAAVTLKHYVCPQ